MLVFFIVLYLMATLAIGYWASRRVRNSTDFMLAGRQLPLALSTSALFATWFGSETLMGATSEFMEHGLIGVMEDPFGAALCLLLIGRFIARPLYRLNILTFGDFYRLRYGRRAELVASLFMIPSFFGWIAAQLVALGVIFNIVLGVSMFVGILIGAAVVLFYTYIGGMWAISIADFFQTIIIIGGLLLLAADVLDQAGGWTQVVANAPEDFFRFLPHPTAHDISHYVAAWMVIGLGSIPSQDIFQRVMASKSERVAVWSSYLGGILYLVIAVLPLTIALCARQLYPELLETDRQLMLPQMVLNHGGVFLQVLLFGALLSAIMSTCSGAILAPASIISENIIRPYLAASPDEDRRMLHLTRMAVIGVTVCSVIMANLNANIFELVGQSSILSLVSLFAPLIAGLYSKSATATGAILSMFTGLAVWIGCEWAGTSFPPLLPGLAANFIGLWVGNWIERRKKLQSAQD